VKTQDGQTLSAIAVVLDDIYDIEATASTGNKVGYYSYPDEGGANNLALSSTAFTKIRYRFHCGSGSVKAKIVLVFSDATTQTILAETNSLLWKTGVVSITTAKTIDHIRLYCNAATGHVYYDFVLIYKDDFTIPNTAHAENFKPQGRYGQLEVLGAQGDTNQNLGTHSAIVDMHCVLDVGNWLRAGDTLPGQVFLDIVHNSVLEPFQWLSLGAQVAQFKVILDMPDFQYATQESKATHTLNLTFREYRRAPANVEGYDERWGFI
jgi:hypothetical protein